MAIAPLEEVIRGLLADEAVVAADGGEGGVAEGSGDVDAGDAGGGDKAGVAFVADVCDEALDILGDAADVEEVHAGGFDEPPAAVFFRVGMDACLELGQLVAKSLSDESDAADFFHLGPPF